MESNLLDQAEFADNPEPRCPVVLALDTSGSMNGAPILELNQALSTFAAALQADRLASLRVEVAIVTFGGPVKVLSLAESGKSVSYEAQNAFVTVDHFSPPKLEASGNVVLENVRRIAEAGVDYISVGALTHSPPVFDVSLKWRPAENP